MTKLNNKIAKVRDELIAESKKRNPDYSKINMAIELEKEKEEEYLSIIEGVLESHWLNLRDIDEEEANEFEKAWYSTEVVIRKDK